MRAFTCILFALVATAAAMSATTRGRIGADRETSLLQTWDKELSNSKSQVNPILRVVSLLKEMQETIQKEQDEDESLYKELACWCNSGSYEKNSQIDESTAKISELEASIESLSAKQAALTTKIKELEASVASNKKELAEAKALRAKQLKEFHGMEMDSIQAIENMKAALVVLTKHTDKEESTNWHEFLQLNTVKSANKGKSKGKDSPLGLEDASEHNLDNFMRTEDFSENNLATSSPKFLQSQDVQAAPKMDDTAIVKLGMKTMASFMQAHGEQMGPSYSAKSGEIVGIMKQMKEQMEADLSDAQKTEMDRASNFAQLSASKTQEIEEGEKMAEQKEDELATTANELAEAKEDLDQTKAALSEFQTFLANLETTCAEADKNFEARKAARMDEIKAVSETIEILTGDEARDAMSATYNFLQVSSETRGRKEAAKILRNAAAKAGNPEMAMLATSVELDAFTKVKKAIDDMIATLKVQQADEVKKNDWCKDEIQENEMTTAKTEDHKSDLEAKISSLEDKIKTLGDELEAAAKSIDELQVELQRASVDRKTENIEFQKTIADQRAVQEVLAKALDKLANFYDKSELLQKSKQAKQSKQTPPVKQMEYKPSGGAGGVMSMIEKLIHEARALEASSVQGETDAQDKYETLVEDTNASIKDLQREIATKTEEKAQSKKEKTETEGDLMDTVTELEGLAKQNSELHSECDYVLKNFDARQTARAQEIEAMQEAKAILSGAQA
eukprot:gnl/TRDRNA2_/TRDRNA2_176204_c8_seq25.p1 gnl/TRDRNA2_/TRDRNA2_176204_c8~~gnl/TRDRNA2_/TRDRNA2_176204_c8_seq25.p1  ORF type:complete len:737 (+),score=272.87 gnl/TRDRNA2_/TRDRNA2_176204_c8_seq25:73-2283(+)